VTPSISRQLIFWLAIPLLVMALCGSLAHYLNQLAPDVLNSDKRLRAAANALMAHVQVVGDRIDLDHSPEAARTLPSADSIKFALRDKAGQLLAGDAQIPPVPMNPDVSQLIAMTYIGKQNLRTLTTRFDTRAGVVFITAADVRAPTGPAARYGFMSTLLWDFVQLDITLVLVWIGIQVGLRSVKRLRDEIAERSPLDLRPIVASSVPREIAPVVVTLNRLFAMLRSAGQSQQQFIANTAHQLRTPITGIQAQLDVLAEEPAAQPIRDRLLILQEGIRQLGHTANQLLTLARAEPSANLTPKNQSVDLSTVASEVVAKFFDRALQSDIDLGVDLRPAPLGADPALLDDMISNLVDNALKYTPAGGRVTVSVGMSDKHVFLAVEDTGPGIPVAERQHVRQRFFRLPNSPGHGSGLGLAIVDEIARLYGASLAIGAGNGDRGTRVALQFP
jgi:two-component system sensor histidine kinase TctE